MKQTGLVVEKGTCQDLGRKNKIMSTPVLFFQQSLDHCIVKLNQTAYMLMGGGDGVSVDQVWAFDTR